MGARRDARILASIPAGESKVVQPSIWERASHALGGLALFGAGCVLATMELVTGVDAAGDLREQLAGMDVSEQFTNILVGLDVFCTMALATATAWGGGWLGLRVGTAPEPHIVHKPMPPEEVYYSRDPGVC